MTIKSNSQDIKSYHGTGRRKSSVARVYLTKGKGKVIVNHREFSEYFPNENAQVQILAPLDAVGMKGEFDIVANIYGGGFTGQSGAMRLGIARALVRYDEATTTTEVPVQSEVEESSVDSKTYRSILGRFKYLTRDARKVERKKYGLRKARRKVQFSKR